MSNPQSHADEVIQRLSRRRKAHACYPCAKRKVRCNGAHPCSICKKRGHPEICFYANSPQASNTRSDSNMMLTSESSASGKSHVAASHIGGSEVASGGYSQASNPGLEPDQQNATCTAVGDLSSAAYVQNGLSPHVPQSLVDIRFGLGLTNVASLRTKGTRHDGFQRPQIAGICPRRSEVLRFLQPFRTHVAPFYPIVSSVDELELSIHRLVDVVEHHEGEYSRTHIAEMALHLSVLAVGAQFSDSSIRIRETQSQDLIDRCDACLRLTRYMANPSSQIVQTLILVGLQAQNAGRSDEAWSLLGLTFRLAQSLGMEGKKEEDQHFLWLVISGGISFIDAVDSECVIPLANAYSRNSILWQDALLSLRYDRKPIYARRLSVPQPDPERSSDYFCCMLNICRLTRQYLLSDGLERSDAKTMKTRLANITVVENSAVDFLKSVDLCTSVQQRLQFYALRMHTSFLTSEMCRPFLLKPSGTLQVPNGVHPELHQLGISRLRRTIEAYLDMARLSTLPLQSWSLTFEGLTAVCVLTLLELRHTSNDVNVLLERFQGFLERELASEEAHEAATYSMLQRGRQLFKLLEKSTSRGLPANKNEPGDRQSGSPMFVSDGTADEQSTGFEAFVDKFWEIEGFSEPDGTLLSMFDPLYDQLLASDTGALESEFNMST